MNRLTSLIWKEWCEAQAYLWIGLGLFLLLPAVGGLEETIRSSHRFSVSTSPWVLALGGVLAVLAAVGATTPDLRPKVADFWQSRPIGVGPWLAAKYAVTLAVVLVACGLPLAAEMALSFRADEADPVYLIFLPFFWTAAFSLAFLAACLIDRPAHAAVLGLAALLLVYVVPVVFPPLRWMNVVNLADVGFLADVRGHGAWHLWLPVLRFASGMLVLSAAAVTVALVAVRHRWRVESGRKSLFGLLATALLLLFASAAFQLGTNLPVLQRVELPADESVRNVVLSGDRGYLLTRAGWLSGRRAVPDSQLRNLYRSIEVNLTGLVLGPPETVTDETASSLQAYGWNQPNRDGFAYRWGTIPIPKRDDVYDVQLTVIDQRPGHATRSLPLWRAKAYGDGAELFVWADRLYVFGDGHLAVFDLARPGQPRVVSNGPFPTRGYRRQLLAGDSGLRCDLIPLPGVPPAGRAAATLAPWGFDGQLLCLRSHTDVDTLFGYRLTGLDDHTATFDLIGRYRPTLLQRLVNRPNGIGVPPSNGLVYVMGYPGNETFSAGVTVLDSRGPRPMQPVGHFAAPGAWFVNPLPDGRAVVGGANTLWLVGTPPRRTGG